jgi:hypothetical protein
MSDERQWEKDVPTTRVNAAAGQVRTLIGNHDDRIEAGLAAAVSIVPIVGGPLGELVHQGATEARRYFEKKAERAWRELCATSIADNWSFDAVLDRLKEADASTIECLDKGFQGYRDSVSEPARLLVVRLMGIYLSGHRTPDRAFKEVARLLSDADEADLVRMAANARAIVSAFQHHNLPRDVETHVSVDFNSMAGPRRGLVGFQPRTAHSALPAGVNSYFEVPEDQRITLELQSVVQWRLQVHLFAFTEIR